MKWIGTTVRIRTSHSETLELNSATSLCKHCLLPTYWSVNTFMLWWSSSLVSFSLLSLSSSTCKLVIIGQAQLPEILFQLPDVCYTTKINTFLYISHYCWLRFCCVALISCLIHWLHRLFWMKIYSSVWKSGKNYGW